MKKLLVLNQIVGENVKRVVAAKGSYTAFEHLYYTIKFNALWGI